ncbi:hypothetical protein NDU88_004440 [Pleurodeles waltl]|uniref:Uncharacterized protein n=1 Tax=Pleurodeles waltl TaxID=8319 RepID=A0AAV7MYF4_PLEWA|nr:hypothetical protein NDU88_004440 [Pleurodeles waltl]
MSSGRPCEERAAPDAPVLIEIAGDAHRGEVPAGPTVPHRHTGSRRPLAGVGRRHRPTRAAQPATAAACLPTRGCGYEREEGRRSPPGPGGTRWLSAPDGSAAGAQTRRSPLSTNYRVGLFNLGDIRDAINNIVRLKAAGPDGIPGDLFLYNINKVHPSRIQCNCWGSSHSRVMEGCRSYTHLRHPDPLQERR